MDKTVYVAMSADMVHTGHLNILKVARRLGRVTVGVLTDEAIASYKRLPYLDFEQRKAIVSEFKDVDTVIAQTTLDYIPNLEKLRPDYVVHGDDWKEGVQKETRQRIIHCLAQWHGEVVDVPYTQGISSTALNQNLKEIGVTPAVRLSRLQRLLNAKSISRFLGIQTGLEARLLENEQVLYDGMKHQFDGVWLSSQAYSHYRGQPMISGNPDITARLQTLDPILNQTTKSILFEDSPNSSVENYGLLLRSLESRGVSGLTISDDKPENIWKKLELGRQLRLSSDFMQIVSVKEWKQGLLTLLSDAGCDAIMLHLKNSTDNKGDIKRCCDIAGDIPLFLHCENRPSGTELTELSAWGVKLLIYGEQLLHAYFSTCQKIMQNLLQNKETKKNNCIQNGQDIAGNIDEFLNRGDIL